MTARLLARALIGVLLCGVAWSLRSNAQDQERLPTGQYLTPTAAPGTHFERLTTALRPDGAGDADGAVSSTVSPDGTAMLVLTSGYDSSYDDIFGRPITHVVVDPSSGQPSNVTTSAAQWIFIYDVRAALPRLVQRLFVPLSYSGVAWDPKGTRFYVSGGPDDRIYVFKAAGGPRVSAGQHWIADPPWIVLGHNSNAQAPLSKQDGGLLKGTHADTPAARRQSLLFSAVAAGIAVSADGKTLYVANMQNDSLSVIDLVQRKVVDEIHFFIPGSRIAHGEYPYWVVAAPAQHGRPTVYVSSLRDGEVVAIHGRQIDTINVGGAPNKMVLAPDRRYLWVANGDLDALDVIDTHDDQLSRVVNLHAASPYMGSNPNSLAFNRDGTMLYVTLGGENALGVIDARRGRVLGRIPTGWYPSSVSLSADGRRLFVINTKSPSGPTAMKIDRVDNPLPLPRGQNNYVYNLEKAGLLSLPIPRSADLTRLSEVVAKNNGVPQESDAMMLFLRSKIHHVIYVMKENRTYDQVLGDLPHANGDPRLVQFGKLLTPNHHRLATQFVTLDNFRASGDVSADGWSWTFQGRANDYNAKSVAFDYGNGGFPYDWQGEPRRQNLSLPVFGSHAVYGERITTLFDPTGSSTILPGTHDIGATAGAGDLQPNARGGFIWDSVLRKGLTHRHYGIYTSLLMYDRRAPYYLLVSRHAFREHKVQAVPVQTELWGRTDLYYRGWDLDVPDQFRFEEWQREFASYVKHGNLPSFEVVDLMNDHFGNFASNVGGLTTPESQMAMNDYALGELVEAVTESRYFRDTAIFVVEDDAQDGPDHVDSHRTVAYVISAYTKRRAIVSTFYTTTSLLATMEDILGIDHLGMFDAAAAPMSDVFTKKSDLTPYRAVVPGILCAPPVHTDLVPACGHTLQPKSANVVPLHDGAWWSAVTRGFNFSQPDAIDSQSFNRILWEGTRGDDAPYPIPAHEEPRANDR